MKAFALALAAAVAAAAAPITAGATGAPRAVVSHADLDLSNAQHRAILDRRVRQAIRQVCDVDDAVDLKSKMAAGKCVRLARIDANRQVDTAAASGTGTFAR